jgi:HptB-dependent secretion and biofilm anti anti-sigma factor
MAMTIKAQIVQERARLSLQGRFDFSAHRDFRQGYESLIGRSGITRVELDLRGVEYIDSSALGMLLVLKEALTRSQQQLMITNCTESVRRILDVANFGKLFVLA